MTETDTRTADPLAGMVDSARRRAELLTDDALAALAEAPTQDDIDALAELAARKRKIERNQEWKDAQAAAAAADAARELEATIRAADHRDQRAARKAVAQQRRRSDPRARLASTYRRSAATSVALAGVVVGGVVISASTVQANIAGNSTPGDMRWWSGFFFEALVSVLLIAIMVTRSTVSEWGIRDDPKSKEARGIVAVEAALLGTSIWLNVFPYLSPDNLRLMDAGVHALPPAAMTAAVIAHTWASRKYGAALEAAHAAVAEHEARTPDALPTVGRTVDSTVETVDHTVVSTVDTDHGSGSSEHRAAPSTVETVDSTVETVASTVAEPWTVGISTVAGAEESQNSTVAEPWSAEISTVAVDSGHGSDSVTVDSDHGSVSEWAEQELRGFLQERREQRGAPLGGGEPTAHSDRSAQHLPADARNAAELGTERAEGDEEVVTESADPVRATEAARGFVAVDRGDDFDGAVTVESDRGTVDLNRGPASSEAGAEVNPAGLDDGDRGAYGAVTVGEPWSTVATVEPVTVDHGSATVTVDDRGHTEGHTVESVTVDRGPVPATGQHTDDGYDYYLVLAREVRSRMRRGKYGVEAIADALIKHYRHGMGLDAIYAAGSHDGGPKGPHRDATANWFRIAQEVMDERTGTMAAVVPLRKEG